MVRRLEFPGRQRYEHGRQSRESPSSLAARRLDLAESLRVRRGLLRGRTPGRGRRASSQTQNPARSGHAAPAARWSRAVSLTFLSNTQSSGLVEAGLSKIFFSPVSHLQAEDRSIGKRFFTNLL